MSYLLAILVCAGLSCHWQRSGTFHSLDDCEYAGKNAPLAVSFKCVLQLEAAP